ncbi:hypothetical protein [Rhizobium leguminosarum]
MILHGVRVGSTCGSIGAAMEELLAGLSGFALGWLFCRTVWKGKSDSMRSVAEKLNRNVDEAEMRYLECLRRELANEMIAEDTEAMYRAFHKMRQYENDLKKDGKERIDADFKSICRKYPSFEEFDPFGTRHFVAYQDARSSMDISDLVDRYSDISQFLIINAARKNLPWELFDDKEAEQLDKAIRNRKDRGFQETDVRCHGEIPCLDARPSKCSRWRRRP